MIEIFNSMTGQKAPLKTLEPRHVRMYVCGMTVYDFCHIGHARSLVAFDVVRRYLKYCGYRVTHVRNITDIDDKIIARAAANGESIETLTKRFIDAMHEDCEQLGVERPEHEPRATEHVPGMIAMITTLIEKEAAYASDGDVLYSVAKFQGYGRLSGKKLADLRAGARVEVDASKRDPLDFVLWKAAKPGEPSWDSPWGKGRPGWHIECSVMSVALLGDHFDLHGGGMDLKFPHHENEIAQTCAACDSAFVNVWMHNGFVNVDAEKMSKSLGNFFTVREVQKHLRPEVLRAFVLSSQYRGPINYSDDNLRQADAGLERLYVALRGITAAAVTAPTEATERFKAAMNDDFNTPEAMAVLQALARDLNIAKTAADTEKVSSIAAELRGLGAVLGLLSCDADTWLKTRPESAGVTNIASGGVAPQAAEIEALIEARRAARAAKDFKESDRVRDLLLARGIILEDGPDGTRWRYR